MTFRFPLAVIAALIAASTQVKAAGEERRVSAQKTTIGDWTVIQRDLGCAIIRDDEHAGKSALSLWRPFRGPPNITVFSGSKGPSASGVRTADRGTLVFDGNVSLPVEASWITVLDPRANDFAPEYYLALKFTSGPEQVAAALSTATEGKAEIHGIRIEPFALSGVGAAWRESDKCLERVGLALMGAAPDTPPGQAPPTREKPLPRDYPGRWIDAAN